MSESSRNPLTASVAMRRISDAVDTIRSDLTAGSSASGSGDSTSDAATKSVTTDPAATTPSDAAAGVAATASPDASTNAIADAAAQLEAEAPPHQPEPKPTASPSPTPSNKQQQQQQQPLAAGDNSKKKTRQQSRQRRRSGRSKSSKSLRSKSLSKQAMSDRIDVVLDNQMRIAQALALKIPAVVRCTQPLPNHRWPGGMNVSSRLTAIDMPDGPDGETPFTWYDGFNVYATENDATTKQFSNEKLRSTQVENAKYPENDDDDDGRDSQTFVHKRAWP